MGLCGKLFTMFPPASLHLCGSFSRAWFSALQSIRMMGRDLPTRNPSIQSPSSSALPKEDCHLSKEDFGPQGAGLEVGGPVNQMPLESHEVSWDRSGHHGQDGGP